VTLQTFQPLASWARGGLIIEREHIDLISDFGRWTACHNKRDDYSRLDPSALVAAIRAYLTWEYGNELPV